MPKSRKNPPRKWTKCPNCQGTGDRRTSLGMLLREPRPCATCNQTGRIPEAAPRRKR